jgi:hypothetical protein
MFPSLTPNRALERRAWICHGRCHILRPPVSPEETHQRANAGRSMSGIRESVTRVSEVLKIAGRVLAATAILDLFGLVLASLWQERRL